MFPKFITILFMTGMLLNLPYIGQLIKMPLLFEHYQEHHQQNRDLSFIEFLVAHYNNAPAHDSRDNSLPFKSTLRMHHAGMQLSVPAACLVLSPMEVSQPPKVNAQLTCIHLLVGSCSNIFQPPRA